MSMFLIKFAPVLVQRNDRFIDIQSDQRWSPSFCDAALCLYDNTRLFQPICPFAATAQAPVHGEDRRNKDSSAKITFTQSYSREDKGGR